VAGTPRILIVRLSAIGDVVHALPVLDALRRALPDAHLGWAAHPGPAGLLEGHPQLDELVLIPRRDWTPGGLMRMRRALRAGGRWDVAVDVQGLTKSGVVALLSGARERIGFAGPASREVNALFTNRRVRPREAAVIRMNLELLRPLGLEPGDARAILHETAEDAAYVQAWADQAGVGPRTTLLLDAFAGWETKFWPRERWVMVAREAVRCHGLRPLVAFGPHEKDAAVALVGDLTAAGCDAVLPPSTTLRQFTALVRRFAAAAVGGDTGPMHIAAAVGVPTVMMFGPSDASRNAPVFAGARFETLQDSSQPCAGTFARRCKHHAPGHCMDGITPDSVLAALGRLVGASSPMQ